MERSFKNYVTLTPMDTILNVLFSDQDVINDLKRVASLLTTETLTAKEYDTYGLYSSSTLAKRYGSWNKLLKLANMEPTLHRNITDKEMFEELERLWTLLGRQPTTTDMKKRPFHLLPSKLCAPDLVDGEMLYKLSLLT